MRYPLYKFIRALLDVSYVTILHNFFFWKISRYILWRYNYFIILLFGDT